MGSDSDSDCCVRTYCTSGNDANKDRFMEWKRDSGGGGNEARAAFRFGLETNTTDCMDGRRTDGMLLLSRSFFAPSLSLPSSHSVGAGRN